VNAGNAGGRDDYLNLILKSVESRRLTPDFLEGIRFEARAVVLSRIDPPSGAVVQARVPGKVKHLWENEGNLDPVFLL